MALTLTNIQRCSDGSKWKILGTMTFDSSYATGGLSLTPATLGLSVIDNFSFEGAAGGFDFVYDGTNKKAKVFNPLPSPTVDEVVTVSSNTGTLAGVPAVVQNVYVTAGTTTGLFNVIPTGTTPLTKQVALTQTTGVLTFLAGDAVSSAKVTYIKQASASAEIANGTNLSTLAVNFAAIGV